MFSESGTLPSSFATVGIEPRRVALHLLLNRARELLVGRRPLRKPDQLDVLRHVLGDRPLK